MDYFNLLPNELLFQIGECLSLKDVNKFVRSNKRIYNICQEIFSRRILQLLNKGELITFQWQSNDNDYHSVIILYLVKDKPMIMELEQEDIFRRLGNFWVLEGYLDYEKYYLGEEKGTKGYVTIKGVTMEKTLNNIQTILKILSKEYKNLTI